MSRQYRSRDHRTSREMVALTGSQGGQRGRIHRGSDSQGYLGSGRREGGVEMGLVARQYRGTRRRLELRQDRRRWVGRGYLMMRRMGHEKRKS